VRVSAAEEPVQRLSGGNQQRVLFARALAEQPAVLLLSDPSRGVDIKAKAAIHGLIAGLAARGLAVCVAGSDIDEMLSLATHVVCMRGGLIVAAGQRTEFDAMRVMEYISRAAPPIHL
jgi:ABC-type sugar transport system ATPase subunit